jgi:hypothetical protein
LLFFQSDSYFVELNARDFCQAVNHSQYEQYRDIDSDRNGAISFLCSGESDAGNSNSLGHQSGWNPAAEAREPQILSELLEGTFYGNRGLTRDASSHSSAYFMMQ